MAHVETAERDTVNAEKTVIEGCQRDYKAIRSSSVPVSVCTHYTTHGGLEHPDTLTFVRLVEGLHLGEKASARQNEVLD